LVSRKPMAAHQVARLNEGMKDWETAKGFQIPDTRFQIDALNLKSEIGNLKSNISPYPHTDLP
jgi:hypothetical protein